MTKAKMVILNEVKKIRSKIFTKKRDVERLEKEVEELEAQADKME